MSKAAKDKAGVTLLQIMSHTSGLDSVYWDAYPELSRPEFVHKLLADLPLAAEPGKKWIYANSGYNILEQVIETISGKPFERFMTDELFIPAGMNTTGYSSDNGRWDKMNVAKYQLWTIDLNQNFLDAKDLLTRPKYLQVALSTAEDLYKWYLSLKNNTIISEQSRNSMFKIVKENYGLGWNIVPTDRGTSLIHHGGSGSGIGMNVTFRWFKDEDIFYCILSNSSTEAISADYLDGDVESLIFGGNLNMPPATEKNKVLNAKYLGTYQFPQGDSIQISKRGGKYIIKATSSDAFMNVRYPDAANDATNRKEDPLSVSILSEAFNNQYETLQRVFFGNDAGFNDCKSELIDGVQKLAPLGKLQKVRTVHEKWFYFSGIPFVQSFLKLHFERGNIMVRAMHYPSGAIYFSVERLPQAWEIMLNPSPYHYYTTWDLKLEAGLRYEFADAPDGKIYLKITGAHGSVQCIKKS